MSKPSHIFVTAAPGKVCPMPAAETVTPGGGLLLVRENKVYRVALTGYVRRRLLAGDLVPCSRGGAVSEGAKALEQADATTATGMHQDMDGSLSAHDQPEHTNERANAPEPAPSASPPDASEATGQAHDGDGAAHVLNEVGSWSGATSTAKGI